MRFIEACIRHLTEAPDILLRFVGWVSWLCCAVEKMCSRGAADCVPNGSG